MRFRITSLLLCSILLLSVMATRSPARTSAAAGMRSPAAVVVTYFNIANSILRGASTSTLSNVYAPGATLVVSNPKGQTSTFHNLPAIEGWYKVWAVGAAGLQLKQVSMRTPLPGMVVHYEVAVDSSTQVIARCAHIFAVVNGKIASDDFIIYYGTR
jgi:hypothetical protein